MSDDDETDDFWDNLAPKYRSMNRAMKNMESNYGGQHGGGKTLPVWKMEDNDNVSS